MVRGRALRLRKSTNRGLPEVRKAMALAVLAAGRCADCGAQAGVPGVKLTAHWPHRGRPHLPVPSMYRVLCTGCHYQRTERGE